jgi:pilus assembly protein CpaB
MPGRNVILIGVAVIIGLIAVFLANTYFSGVETRQAQVAKEQKLARIVVASQDLAFGTPLSTQNLRLVNYPANAVPVGAFTSLEAATQNGRVALRPIVVNEPVLASKVSGANGRATLSANLPVGKLAYAIPVNDVSSVGGFVRPGDVVDVLLTRQIPGDGASGNDKMTDVVMEAIPVLGIDQVSDENATKPAPGRTATLQVDTIGAQKLALASQLGTLSLALRNVADPTVGPAGTVIPRHLSATNYYLGGRRTGAPAARPMLAAANIIQRPLMPAGPPRPKGPSMTVVRGSVSSDYEVLRGH